MSLFATINGKGFGDVATNSGWTDFCRWVAEMSGADSLRHLTEYGWAEGEIDGLSAELESAIEVGDPTDDQRSIGEGLLAILADADDDAVVVVSNGEGEGEGEDDEPVKRFEFVSRNGKHLYP